MKNPSPVDNAFINKLIDIVLENISNEDFGVEQLAEEADMNRTSLYRRVKSITGKNVSQVVREIRLQKAQELLIGGLSTASEVAYKVGFSSPSYFNNCFSKYFGYPPGEARKRHSGMSADHHQAEASSSLINLQQKQPEKRHGLRVKLLILRYKLPLLIGIPVLIMLVILFMDMIPSDKDKNTIVVLPFKNLGTEKEAEYFADAIMDGILNQLSIIEDLSVRSRTTSDFIGAKNMPLRKISHTVRARYILEGSVQKTGDRVRITVQFIDGKKDTHIWSENFDRKYENILGIQSDIALTVASKLNASLTESETRRIRAYSTKNSEAWDNYLRGRFLANKANTEQRIDISPDGLKTSLRYFARAIELDSSFAQAYAGMAHTYLNLAAWNWLPDRVEGMMKAAQFTKKALELDPDCAEANAVLGALVIWGGGKPDFEKGREAFQKALHVKPEYPPVLQWYAQLLMITGPIEEARRHMDRVIEAEPFFWLMRNLDAWIYYFEGKHTEAITACKLAEELKPDWAITHWLFFLNYAKLKNGDKAVEHLQKIFQSDPIAMQYADDISTYYNSSGIEGLFAFLIYINDNHPGVIDGINGQPFYNGWWNALLGNEDESIFYLQKALGKIESSYTYFMLIAVNPDFDFLRGNPEFQAIIDKLGLSPYNSRTII
ncbi:MAG: helix-turn-helix domain-containing protein [Bacteroidales bacterium]|nr:helix-turn-helix domain-containing protein [Bacteroidales bacterium]